MQMRVPQCAWLYHAAHLHPHTRSARSQRVRLGQCGIVRKLGIGKLNEQEQAMLEDMTPQLIAEIEKGTAWSRPEPHVA